LESDKEKRGRAPNDKSQKLRSPLFFINPLRLIIQNLAKHTAKESQFRTLIVEGLERGLQKQLVSKEDIFYSGKQGQDKGTGRKTCPSIIDSNKKEKWNSFE